MKKLLSILISTLLLSGVFSVSALASDGLDPEVYDIDSMESGKYSAEINRQLAEEYEPNVLLIKFHPVSMFPGKEKQYQDELEKVKKWGFDYIAALDVHVVKIEDMDKNPNAALSRFKNNRFIEYVEPNYIGESDIVPNDKDYKSLKSYAGIINAEAGWDIITNSNVPVSVVDSGYSGNSDLPAATGYSVFNKNTTLTDVYGHGTKVAGALGAKGNNSTGTTGVVWNAKIIPVKVTESSSYLASNVASAITWAADNGAKVINTSISFTTDSATIKNAVNYAYNKGCIIVASAGNNGKNGVNWPALYPNTLAVGGMSNISSRASNSNYGTGVDVMASYSWYTTQPNGTYAAVSGTSVSAPQVAGLAALVWELAPSLNNEGVMKLIRDNTNRADGKWDAQTGYGVIDMGKTLKAASLLVNVAPTEPATEPPTEAPAAPPPAVTPPPALKEIITRAEHSFKGSGNPNKGPVPFSHTAVAEAAGTMTLKAEGISGYVLDITVKDSTGKTVLDRKEFKANGTVDVNIAAGKCTIDVSLRDGKGNCSYTLKVLMPEVITLVDADTPLAGFADEKLISMEMIILLSVILLAVAASSVLVLKKRSKAQDK